MQINDASITGHRGQDGAERSISHGPRMCGRTGGGLVAPAVYQTSDTMEKPRRGKATGLGDHKTR